MAKSRIAVLLVAFVAWCAVPASLPAHSAACAGVTIVSRTAPVSKLWSGNRAVRGPVAPACVRVKLHALRGFELAFAESSASVAQQIGGPLLAMWLPDQRAAIRQGCPRFDRPDSVRRVA